MNESKEVTIFEKGLTKFQVQEYVFEDFAKAEQIECKDTASRKILGKHRQDAKGLRSKIETARLDINRTHRAKTDEEAEALKAKLNGSITIFDSKIFVFDDANKKRLAAKAKIETDRLGKIQWLMDGLDVDCTAGLEYNLTADEIQGFLTILLDTEIGEDYHEKTDEAKILLSSSVTMTQNALEKRIEWEEERAEAAREKEILDKEKAEFKAAQVKEREKQAAEQAERDRIQKEKDDAAAKLAAQEAEKTRKANEKLEADRKALDEEKAQIASEKQIEESRKEALEQFNADHVAALAEHEEYKVFLDQEIAMLQGDAQTRWVADEKDRKEKLKSDTARARLVKKDKALIAGIVKEVDGFMMKINLPLFKTDEASNAANDALKNIYHELQTLRQAGINLV